MDSYHRWLGIPPREQPPTHYRLLGLETFESDLDVIENAADRQTAHVRKFASGQHAKEATELLNKIARARVVLMDTTKKSGYDEELRIGLTAPAPPVRPSVNAVPPPRVKSGPESVTNIPQHIPPSRRLTKRKAGFSPALVAGGCAAGIGLLVVLVWVLSTAFQREETPDASDTSIAKAPIQPRPAPGSKKTTTAEQDAKKRSDAEAAARLQKALDAAEKANRVKPVQKPRIVRIPPRKQGVPRVRPKGGGFGTTDPAPGDNRSTNGDPDAEPRANEPGEKVQPPAQRLAIPTAAEQQRAGQEIREAYRAKIAEANTPGEKANLAAYLRSQVMQLRADPAAQFVLLHEAHTLAVAAGQPRLALDIVSDLERFDVDLPAEYLKVLADLSKTVTDQRRSELVQRTMEQAEKTAAVKRFDVALKMTEVADSVATRARNTSLRRRIRAERDRIIQRQKAHERVQRVAQRFEENPADPRASLAYGKLVCLEDGNWEKGLPLLTKSDEVKIRQAAEADLASPATPDDQGQVADLWFQLAESDSELRSFYARAHHWYRKSAPGLTAVAAIKARNRIQEIENMRLPAHLFEADSASGAKPSAQTDGSESPEELTLVKQTTLSAGVLRQRGHLAISHDRKLLACGVEGGAIKVWDLTKNSLKTTLKGNQRPPESLAFANRSRVLIAAGDDVLRAWNVASGRLVGKPIPFKVRSPRLAVSADGRVLASASAGVPKVVLWDANKLKMVATIKLPNNVRGTDCLAFNSQGNTLAVGARRGVRLWDAQTGELSATLTTNIGYPRALVFTPDGQSLLIGESSSPLQLVDLNTYAGQPFEGRQPVNDLALSPNGEWLAVATNSPIVTLWSVSQRKKLTELEPAPRAAIHHVAWAGDDLLVTAGESVNIWQVRTSSAASPSAPAPSFGAPGRPSKATSTRPPRGAATSGVKTTRRRSNAAARATTGYADGRENPPGN